MGLFRRRDEYDQDLYDYTGVEEVINTPLYVEDEQVDQQQYNAVPTSPSRLVSDVIAPWDLQIDQSQLELNQAQSQIMSRAQGSGIVMDILPSY